MEIIHADIAIVGAGGAGLRAAIAAAENWPEGKIALISKVYPMRSHTVAAEGGAAGVIHPDDSLDKHFQDTVSGGDWLCDQDVVEFFVERAPAELAILERWGCPWSRTLDGHVCVRKFGGMKVPRTWFAADRSGFHILHTLYHHSTQFKNITRFDEHFAIDLIEYDNAIRGLLTYDIQNGVFRLFCAPAVILATGGAAQAYHFTTNATIVTGDGMALAYRHGVPLRDMEFVQYHPTGLPGCGLLITEAARGEGGVLINKEGYRYLQDYGLGPETPKGEPQNRTMELGPRDRLSQAFWHEQKKERTIQTPHGDVVYLDLRHLGAAKLEERLPQICELSRAYAGVDPALAPIPVRPVVHYTMGGIETDCHTVTSMHGLFAAGECASVGLHGANRLGSNSLSEILVFGHEAGRHAVDFAKNSDACDVKRIQNIANEQINHVMRRFDKKINDDSTAKIRHEMGTTMEKYVGIYRDEEGLQIAANIIKDLKMRQKDLRVSSPESRVFNFDLLQILELGFTLDVAEAMVHSALGRRESRGSHQRIDGDNQAYTKRDDSLFLKHTRAFYCDDNNPNIQYAPVTITKYPPQERLYGNAEKQNLKNQNTGNDNG